MNYIGVFFGTFILLAMKTLKLRLFLAFLYHLEKASSIKNAQPATSAPHFSTNFSHADIVPPVASKSSISRTFRKSISMNF